MTRPLSVLRLKRRFLKVLYVYTSKGTYYPNQIILHFIPKFFKRNPPELLLEEKRNGNVAINELIRDGYLQLMPGKRNIYLLTEKGVEVAAKNINEMKIQNVDFIALLAPRFDLIKKVRSDYLLGNFEDSIFKAYKLLEEKVRLKSQQPSSEIGISLMNKAFKPEGGLLKHPQTETRSEKEGIHFLMRGAISFFKNPSSHRTVDWSDPNTSAHIIAFAKFLLDLVDECELSK